MSADDYTRPERSAEITQARKALKRMKSARSKHGNCRICVHREVTFNVYHCRNREDRQHGMCAFDGKAPTFQFDDAVLPEFADAA